ncbi:pyridoxamine 5'-phosphate oxidase [SAR86 cluster bacterium]|nr:pyridoxamine 5'-phosphate oxidase [SAR86 cluster bacterium]
MIIERNITSKPLAKVAEILSKSEKLNLIDWNAMNISTVDAENKPSSRMVLLKKINDQGLVFYTNFNSKKGQDLKNNSSVAVNFWWRELKEQIRIEGSVIELTDQESDDYFNSRALQSRVAAIISQQSEKIESQESLQKKIDEQTKIYANKGENPERPNHCGLYLIKPDSIELWKEGDFRTHEREKFTKNKEGIWESYFLSP